jgi:hypothetical protein
VSVVGIRTKAAETLRPDVEWKMADGKTTGFCRPPFAIAIQDAYFSILVNLVPTIALPIGGVLPI